MGRSKPRKSTSVRGANRTQEKKAAYAYHQERMKKTHPKRVVRTKAKPHKIERSTRVKKSGTRKVSFARHHNTMQYLWFDEQSLFVWYRTIPIVFIFVLGLVAALILKGPNEFQKNYYPVMYQAEIQDAANRHVVSPYLVCAIIKAESDWNPEVESHRNAQGLMQLLPSTAEYLVEIGAVDGEKYPVDQLKDPAVNIEYGTAYLRYLVNKYHEIEPVIAAYNAGPGNVDKWRKEGTDIREVIQFPETEKYLLKVVRAKAAYETLYPTTFVRPLGKKVKMQRL